MKLSSISTQPLVCGLMLFWVGTTAIACEHPPIPTIPDKEDIGRQTRRIERDTQRYFGAMVEYVACIQAQFNAAKNSGGSLLQLELLLRRNNTAVAEFEAIANLFADRIGPVEALEFQRIPGAPNDSASAAAMTVLGTDQLDELIDAEPVNCISVAALRRTRVINDKSVLFYRRSGRVFLNVLQDACPGLLRAGGFSYQVRGGRNPSLCETDLIYPIQSFTGTGLPCKLAGFYEISETQADALSDSGGASRQGGSIVVEPVELPDEDEAE